MRGGRVVRLLVRLRRLLRELIPPDRPGTDLERCITSGGDPLALAMAEVSTRLSPPLA